jgi:DNA-binding PadR family transcriptional regulator
MNSSQRQGGPLTLTELEGAILSEIHHRGAETAFKVRKAFLSSPSLEWSGSSGAVYPAIRRLSAQGLIRGEAQNSARKGSSLSLTADGVAALDSWIGDLDRATGLGLDPFRLRSGLWDELPEKVRSEKLAGLLIVLKRGITDLEAYGAGLDRVERRRVDLSISQQKARAVWVEAELAAIESDGGLAG